MDDVRCLLYSCRYKGRCSVMNFYIMNKDTIVAEFICQSIGPVKQIYISDILREDLLPISIKNGFLFNDWLNSRLVLSHRTNIMEMFSQIGITNIEDILQITRGVSLNDTYWVKSAVEEKTKWNSVSPYTNPLNRDIANYSFDNARVINSKKITHSPDFATSGQFPKCWKKMNGNIYLIKGGTVGHAAAGNEPYSEIHADILSTYLGFNHINYEYIYYHKLNATKCLNMCNESIGIYPLNEVFPDVKTYSDFLDLSIKRGEEKQALDTLLLDYLILNTDRHLGNISYFVNNDTQELLGITPIYDNNLAFLPTYLKKFDKNIEAYIENASSGIVTRLGISFEELFDLIDCKYVWEKVNLLKNYTIKSKFERCDVANQVLQRQLSLIKY